MLLFCGKVFSGLVAGVSSGPGFDSMSPQLYRFFSSCACFLVGKVDVCCFVFCGGGGVFGEYNSCDFQSG